MEFEKRAGGAYPSAGTGKTEVLPGMSFESFLARHYLRVKHQRRLVPLITALATFGVALGVAVLVVVIAVMSGFQFELKRRILGIESHMIVMKYNEWIQGHRKVTGQIESIQGVEKASPFIFTQGMVRSGSGVSGAVLRGIDPANTTVQVSTKGGRSLAQMLSAGTQGNETGIVIGSVLAEKLKLDVGQGALLMMVGTQQENSRQLPRMHRLKVVGIFETGMHQYDGSFCFLDMQQLQQLMRIGDYATGIEIRLVDPDDVESVQREIAAGIGMQFWSNNWKQMHRNLFSMLALQKVMMFVILTLIIVVAAFNIASALIMMVKEKTKDIGILKAMGATRKSLLKVFLAKGLVIGLVGIVAGGLAGGLVCLLLAQYQFIELPGDVYFLTTLPVQIHLFDMAVIVLGTLVVCLAASYIPARQAARMRPVDGIRYS
jgi:lipoprotein-releasing system permease protein